MSILYSAWRSREKSVHFGQYTASSEIVNGRLSQALQLVEGGGASVLGVQEWMEEPDLSVVSC